MQERIRSSVNHDVLPVTLDDPRAETAILNGRWELWETTEDLRVQYNLLVRFAQRKSKDRNHNCMCGSCLNRVAGVTNKLSRHLLHLEGYDDVTIEKFCMTTDFFVVPGKRGLDLVRGVDAYVQKTNPPRPWAQSFGPTF